MANTSAGLPGNGKTAFYHIQFDTSLLAPSGPEPARSAALAAACDGDFQIMENWFGGVKVDTPITLTVTPQSGGASWNTGDPQSVTLNPGSGGPATLRYLVVSEVTEIFMFEFYKSWDAPGGWLNTGGVKDEGSMGEGLSRFLAAQLMIQTGIGAGPIPNFQVSDDWLNSPRADFVNHEPDDHNPDAVTGCTTLFIYYLHTQLGFSITSIIKAGSSSLAGAYEKLTQDSADPFGTFKQMLDIAFPSTTASAIGSSNIDNPFPLPTDRSLSALRYVAALKPDKRTQSIRALIAETSQASLRPTLNSNRPAALI